MSVGDRVITTEGFFGTIRYVGTVPAWGQTVAFGIEWDQAERGKNDGTLQGVRYFQTKKPTSGSFLKSSSNKLDHSRSTFVSAMHYSYGSSEIQKEISFGTKTTQSLGFEKLSKMQSNFSNLRVVSLQRCNISLAATTREELEVQLAQLQHLTTLDLGYNLFSDIQQVWQIVDQLKGLEELTLNGNKFTGTEIEKNEASSPITCLNLRALHLIDTGLSLVQVGEMLKKFPNLQVLTLSSNGYRDEDIVLSMFPSSLRSLDLSFNELTKIPDFHHLTTVNLSNNRIKYCSVPHNASQVKGLDLRYNEIDSWDEIDHVYLSFTNLSEIRINGNPILQDLSIDDMTINLIARLDCTHERSGTGIAKLNGTYLSKDEIANSELYFISMVQKGTYRYNLSSKRWKQLTRKHNMKQETVVRDVEEITKLQSKILNLQVVIEDKIIQRTFLKTNTVLKIKGIIGRLIKIPVINIRLKYFITEAEDEGQMEKIMDDNFAIIDTYDLEKGQKIYIEIV
ncbi:protein Pac2p [[Candida] railenensis]|uniref:Protein Pac2p n=1 Tax=[Candida] railenensis TaxID=45579 RepID=A0A9P0VYK7_9ASCO|nr:protein Pac2p [[Candida] railenensis]